MDDLLTAINIEAPLLRDIDGTVKTEWDSPLKDAVRNTQMFFKPGSHNFCIYFSFSRI
jgi:hypothetical protein